VDIVGLDTRHVVGGQHRLPNLGPLLGAQPCLGLGRTGLSLSRAGLALSCGAHCTLVTGVLSLGSAGSVLLLLAVALALRIALLRGVMFLLLGALLRVLAMLMRRHAGLVRRHAGRISTMLARFGLVSLMTPMLLRLPMLMHLLLRMPMRRRAGRCLSSAFRMAILFGLVRPHAVMSLAFAYRLVALAVPSARSMIPITGRVSFSNGS